MILILLGCLFGFNNLVDMIYTTSGLASLLQGIAELLILPNYLFGQSLPHLHQCSLEVLQLHILALQILLQSHHHCLPTHQTYLCTSVILSLRSHQLAQLTHFFLLYAF